MIQKVSGFGKLLKIRGLAYDFMRMEVHNGWEWAG